MDDFEDLPVETVAGERPAGRAADRMLVGLATVALLGGLLIAAGNVLGQLLPESAAEPSISASATSTAEPPATPRPTPTERPLREVGVIPGEPPEPGDGPVFEPSQTYWLEAIEPLPVYGSQTTRFDPIDRIAAGDIVIAERDPFAGQEDEGWLYLHTARAPGWVRTVDDEGNPLAMLHETETPVSPSVVRVVAAGPAEFVAHGWRQTSGWQPGAAMTLSSVDGASWTPADTQFENHGFGAWTAAWGPSGWVAANTIEPEGPPRTWLWESATGASWSPVGELIVPRASYVKQLVGSERGYVLAFGLDTPDISSLWYSPDGLVWQESVDPFTSVPGSEYPDDIVNLAATEAGFVAWRLTARQVDGVVAAFSANGRTWTPIDVASETSVAWLQLALVGDSIIGLGRDPGGVTRAYSAPLGTADGGTIALSRAAHLDVAFDGAGIWTLVSDGQAAYAFGYEGSDRQDAVWIGDGSSWRRIPPPADGFNEPVHLAAAGPGGVVAVGAQPNGVVTDPVLWHLGPDEAWTRQVTQAFPGVPPVDRGECPEPPDSGLEFMTLHATVAVPCFGGRPLTFTAWSADCDGCWGRGRASRGPAAWLMNPPRAFFLLPMESRAGDGWWKDAIPAAGLEWRDEYVGAWLRITGHYDDPAAAECRRRVPAEELYYAGPLAEENACRQRFVVTQATVVEGPRS